MIEEHKDYDIFCYVKSREIGEVCSDNKKHTQKEYDENLKHQFWIPTQEQLWDKVWKTAEKYIIQMHFGINESENGFQLQVNTVSPNFNYKKEYFADSIKGCLLQYIYEAEYNKVWTDGKWAKG